MKINLTEAQAVADTLDEQALMEKLEVTRLIFLVFSYLMTTEGFLGRSCDEHLLSEWQVVSRNWIKGKQVERADSHGKVQFSAGRGCQ